MHKVCIQKLAENGDFPITAYGKKAELSQGFELFFLIKHSHRATLDTVSQIIEDTIIWFDPRNSNDLSEAFLMLINKANRRLTDLNLKTPLDWLNLFIGAMKSWHLHFSQIGTDIQWLLISQTKVVDVSEDMSDESGLFWFDSSGQLTSGETLYLFSHDIFTSLSEETLLWLNSEINYERRGEEIHDDIVSSNAFHNGIALIIWYESPEALVHAPKNTAKSIGNLW